MSDYVKTTEEPNSESRITNSESMDNSNEQKPRLDLDAVRAKLAGKKGAHYWRSLEQVAETPEFEAWLADEFPNRRSIADIDRRSLLKVMGASLALAGLSGCRGYFMPEEKIVPYVNQPEEMVIGKPLYYATAFTHAGYAYGALVKQNEGRPTKIEGNPDHPANRGAANVQMQASILSLYDPDRAQSVLSNGELSTWEDFLKVVRKDLADQKKTGGAGFRLLTGTVTSPTLQAQIQELMRDFPRMTWHVYEPFGQDNSHAGMQMAYGQPLAPIYDFSKVKVVVSLDSDFLLQQPGSLRYAADFIEARRVKNGDVAMNRLYTIETTTSITGAMSDHRWGVKPSDLLRVAAALHGAVTGAAPEKGSVPVDAIARDLVANRGAAVVVPGEFAPPEVHAACAAINASIGAPVSLVRRFDIPLGQTTGNVAPPTGPQGLKELVDALNAKQVQVLMIAGGNPVYDAPADYNFRAAMANAPRRIRYGYYVDETSKECDWHLPATHFLEEWSDTRAFDGTVSIVQPLTMPLFEGRSIHEVLDAIAGRPQPGLARVQSTWRGASGADFDKRWREWLHQGVIPNTAATPVTAGSTSTFTPAAPATNGGGLEVNFRPDPHLHDGRYSNNGWLMEYPRPIIQVTWDNVALMSPKTAQDLNVRSEDKVELQLRGATVQAPAWISPGQPDGVVTLYAGYGRQNAGSVAEGAGFNVYPMRTSGAMYYDSGLQVKSVGGVWPVACTQIHHQMEGRDIVRIGTMDEFRRDKSLYRAEEKLDHEEIREQNMYPDEIFNANDIPQWGMTIDMHACIGCNACGVACVAENNIPVVGKEQVKRGREMHWLRIDRYYTVNDAASEKAVREDNIGLQDPIANPMTVFQPMMCVHCEKAPCEPVCPVAATVHSHEGLNQMIYNRCVGTRYCSNNCPYKVRRFNYLNYSDNQPQFANLDFSTGLAWAPAPIHSPKEHGIELLRMLSNPDVTVRGRGVMEKCTYCTQRISQTRIEAKKQGRNIADGEIITACQQACPTNAIVFGNIADPNSKVSQMKRDPRNYMLLEEEQTRPRTSYLGRITNPNKEISG